MGRITHAPVALVASTMWLLRWTLAWAVVLSRGAALGELVLVDNGYDGLVVSVSDQIPQEHCNAVIHGLKVRREAAHGLRASRIPGPGGGNAV